MKKYFAILFAWLLPIAAHAQGLAIFPAQQAQTTSAAPLAFGIDPQWKVIALIVIRLSLVSMLGISAVIAIMSAFNWINGEGNEEKIHHNKVRLGNTLLMITLILVLLAVFHAFVPNYHTLAL